MPDDAIAMNRLLDEHNAEVCVLYTWQYDEAMRTALPTPRYYLATPGTARTPELALTPSFTSLLDLISHCRAAGTDSTTLARSA